MEKRVAQMGVFVQPNGGLVVQRGGIMTPIAGAKITCVEDIEALPWTKDQIADALMFRMCDVFVRDEATDWETKKKAIYAMIYHMYGNFTDPEGNVIVIDDDIVRTTLAYNQFAPENNLAYEYWRLGDITPE